MSYLRTFAIILAVTTAMLGGTWLLGMLALWSAFHFGWWVPLVGSVVLLAAAFTWIIEGTRDRP